MDNESFLLSIPEFFYDIIGKMTVGAIALALYNWECIQELRTEKASVLMLFSVLIFAWAIGITLQAIGEGTHQLKRTLLPI